MDAIVRSPLPSPAGPLRSAGITPPPRYLGPVRHPLAVGRFPGETGYTAYPAPPISRRDEEGFSSCLTCPARRAVAHTPPERTRRVSQTATIPAAFARKVGARPPEPFLEATLAFTHVTARPLAPILPMVSSMGSRALVSRRPAIQATGRLAVAPVGLPPTEHVCLLWTHTSSTITGLALISRSTRMRPTSGPSSSPRRAGSWRFRKSVACIIATSAGRRSSAPSVLTTTELASQVRLCLPLPVLLANPV